MKKLPPTPRVVADRTVHDALREIAMTVNQIVDVLNQGNGLPEYSNDTAAAAGGLALYSFYRTGSAVKQRIS